MSKEIRFLSQLGGKMNHIGVVSVKRYQGLDDFRDSNIWEIGQEINSIQPGCHQCNIAVDFIRRLKRNEKHQCGDMNYHTTTEKGRKTIRAVC